MAFGEIARTVRPGGRAVVGLADPEAMASMPFTAHGFRLRPVDDVIWPHGWPASTKYVTTGSVLATALTTCWS